jgi:hypothetical protein
LDADSLAYEKSRSKDLASAILGEPSSADDPQKLRLRIADLEVHRDETNANWWNNLAGAYLRLNQPAEAVKILKPVVVKFPNDYGIHANLGTAYHLLGRYADAEKEIARDLEINPDAHFGVEKYHLALLQYLLRDTKYHSRHVYVDELTVPFLTARSYWMLSSSEDYILAKARADYANGLTQAERNLAQLSGAKISEWDMDSFRLLAEASALDEKPAYRRNWNLVENTNFEAGIIYMAQMNPKEPAAFEMLGIAAWQNSNYHLAASAFEKAIGLSSLKSDLLRVKIIGLKQYMGESFGGSTRHDAEEIIVATVEKLCLVLFVSLVALYTYRKIRVWRRVQQANTKT